MNRLIATRPIQNLVPESEKSVKLEFQTLEEFDNWKKSESSTIEWRKRDGKIGTRKPEGSRGRPVTVEWTRIYRCPFHGHKKAYQRHGKNRVNTKDSIKVGCQASIKVRKEFDDNTIFVTYNKEHTGHQVNSAEDWKKQRLPPVLRTWLQEVIAAGADWTAVKNLVLPREGGENILEKLGLEGAESQINIGNESVELPHMLRLTYHDFYNARRKHINSTAQLDPKCFESLRKYQCLIEEKGGLSQLKTFKLVEGLEDDFLFSFCTSWQLQQFRRYSSLLCLDSTHNTCFALDDRSRKAYLYTIVVKNDVAGCGIPVAFMITSSETSVPLEQWLKWLKEAVPLAESPIFMIDCSRTEVAALNSTFTKPQIRFCYWHFFRALQKNLMSKLKEPTARKLAMQDFQALVSTQTVLELREGWVRYKQKYGSHQEWINYLEKQWIGDAEKWWKGCRMDMAEIHTNNLVESWHNMLKTVYLKGTRKQRPDMLVYKIINEALRDLELKVVRIALGFEKRRTSLAEKNQKSQCDSMSNDLAFNLVSCSSSQEGEKEVEAIQVKSFTKDSVSYTVSRNQNGHIICCECPYGTKNSSVCKHMYIATRVLGYPLCYEMRGLHMPEPSQSNEVLPQAPCESDRNDQLKSELSGLLQNLPSLITHFDQLPEAENRILEAAIENLRSIQRAMGNNESSWSGTQRR